MSRTLLDKTILVTREKSQAQVFSNLLSSRGANPIEIPLLKINCLQMSGELKKKRFDWIFFTSAHGVTCFVEQLRDTSFFETCKIATVGHKTELALKKYGLTADFIPTTYNAVVMAKEFLEKYPNASNLLLVRGSISRKELIEAFTKHGVTYQTVTVYETNFNEEMRVTLIETLTNERMDFLTFTSPSTVKAFYKFVQEDEKLEQYLQIPTICIGTTTENCALQLGFKYTFIPESFTIESMVDKLEEIVHMEG